MRSGNFLFLAVGICHLAGSVSASPTPPPTAPTAQTKNGSYYGSHLAYYNVDTFLGIPYVQPPVGDLRYRAPMPLNNTWDGFKNATIYGNKCIGYGGSYGGGPRPFSEDCLTLNVIRPSGYENVKLPVAIWIHGGNYQNGASSDPRYNLTFFVQNSAEAGNPIIGVSINYRLHTWGFLFSQEIKDQKVANLGLRDQRAAITWVHENINGFGGDPARVTIWGESAGAGSVGAQLVAYGGRDDGLYRAAIMESGTSPTWGRYPSMSDHQSMYNAIVNATGCSAASDSLDCLRKVPTEQLNRVLNSSITAADYQIPVIDGDFIITDPTIQMRTGNFVKVPLLQGVNFDEGATFAPRNVNTSAQFRQYLSTLTPDNSSIAMLEALYPDIPEIGIPETMVGRAPARLGYQFKRAAAVSGDSLMMAPLRFQNQAWTNYNITCYSYRFNVLITQPVNNIGVGHATEIPFVMNNLNDDGYVEYGVPNPFAGQPETYRELSRMMTRMWSSFVTHLDPNYSGVLTAPEWPAYAKSYPVNYIFNANITNLAYLEPDVYRAEAIDYFIQNLDTVFAR